MPALGTGCRTTWLAICVATLPAGAAAQPPSAGWTWSAEADVVSRYVWRGIPYSDGAVVQPSTWVSGHGVTFTVWSNLVVADAINRGTFDQVFVTAAWQKTIGRLRVEPALQGYSSKSAGGAGNATTVEVAARVSVAAGSFRVFSNQTVDIATFAGDYVGDAGVSRALALARRLELTAQASAAWASASFNNDYVGVRAGAMNYAAAGGALTLNLGRHWYVRPHVEAYRLIDNRVRRAIGSTIIAAGGVAVGRAY